MRRLIVAFHLSIQTKRRNTMGERGSKKDKEKLNKQKKQQLEKKQEQKKSKMPVKKTV